MAAKGSRYLKYAVTFGLKLFFFDIQLKRLLTNYLLSTRGQIIFLKISKLHWKLPLLSTVSHSPVLSYLK